MPDSSDPTENSGYMPTASPSEENAPPQLGDDVELVDALSSGDIVYFERVAPARVLVRAMTTDLLHSYTGALFVLDLGDGSSSARFLQVTRDQVE